MKLGNILDAAVENNEIPPRSSRQETSIQGLGGWTLLKSKVRILYGHSGLGRYAGPELAYLKTNPLSFSSVGGNIETFSSPQLFAAECKAVVG